MTTILLVAHVLLAILAFGVDLGYGAALWLARRDESLYAHLLRSAHALDRVAAPAFWGVLVTGVALAWPDRLGAPWVVASLVLFGVMAILGWRALGPAMERPTRRAAAWALLMVALLLVALWLMVAKPG